MLGYRVPQPGCHGCVREEGQDDQDDGLRCKSLVNPRQIDVVHKVFTPTQKEIIFAEGRKEIDEKKAQGISVFTVDGKMIDIAFDGAKGTIAGKSIRRI